MLGDVLVWVLIVGLALLLVFGIVGGWFSHHNSNFAVLTAFHDLQPKDKQEGIEVIIEQKAGKKQFEQSSGDKLFSGFEMRSRVEMREDKNELQ
jgi:hypothetical protein